MDEWFVTIVCLTLVALAAIGKDQVGVVVRLIDLLKTLFTKRPTDQ